MADLNEIPELVRRAGDGDAQALGTLFAENRERLRRVVQLRLDRRLRGRLDASDVLQEAYLEVSRCLPNYLRNPELPFFLWVRMLTVRKLQALHRHHLGTHLRDARRDIALDGGPQASSESLAAQLLGRFTTPSEAAVRAELQARIQEALDSMTLLDREVLALRHFEQLNNTETAQVLGISEAAASNRFVRALKRLRRILDPASGTESELPPSGP
jgi:RNA polymerase sigma-70 factor (ECF subfamily)